jgi:iron-sulfur cluster assembly protein
MNEPTAPTPPAEPAAPTITVTPKAIEAIARMRADGKIPDDQAMRIGIYGGGCSGFSYRLGWDRSDPLNDYAFNYPPGVCIVISREHMRYVAGITLDYEDGLNGKGFKFNNPNAKSSCGCGESVST